jgi:hypothetical protein
MADFKLADFVKESSTTTGTGTYSLAGAVAGHQGFVAAGCAGAQVPYVVTNGTDWEIGLGTVTDAATDTLSRDKVYASSNAGSAVNWSAGTRDVYLAEISGFPRGVVTVTGNTTLGYAHNTVLCNSASALTITLPPAAEYAGKEYSIANINTGKVTIDGNSTEEIRDVSFGAATTFDLWVQYDSVRIVSDGNAWWVLAKNVTAHKAILRRDAAQSIANNTLVQVDFDAATFAIGASYDFAETYELLVNRAGKYILGVQYTNTVDDAEWINVYVRSAATDYLFNRTFSSLASGAPYINPAKLVSIAAGESIGLQVRHTLGSDQNTATTSVARPELSLMEVL